MNRLFEAGLEIQSFLRARQWDFCIIGGLAVARWGEPRVTQDVDVTILAGFGEEKPYVQDVLAHFPSRIPDAAKFASKNRVLLVAASNGIPLDLTLGGIAFEEQAVRRATPFEFAPDCSLVTCSAEDLVVFKAFADRTSDWADLEGILIRQAKRLDWDYIGQQLAPLCELKGASEIPDRLKQLRQTTEAD